MLLEQCAVMYRVFGNDQGVRLLEHVIGTNTVLYTTSMNLLRVFLTKYGYNP